MGRIVLAGLIGAVAMFIWSAVAHTVTPLGDATIGQLSETSPAPAGLLAELGDKDGLYVFPGVGGDPHADEAAAAKMAERMKTGPSGFVLYHGPGRSDAMAPLMIREFVLELVQSLILAWLLAGLAVATLGRRVLVALAAGVAVGIGTNGSYWVWWGFPLEYTLGSVAIQVIGYTLAGVAIALILGRKTATA